MATKFFKQPLADRMRPSSLTEFFGQNKILGDGKVLRYLINEDKIPSMILWGPPGSGKTTLAHIIAQTTKSSFIKINATDSGVKDVRSAIKCAYEGDVKSQRTIVFIDEIHRFNKTQQDSLLPYVEDGTIILIGATTENPSFGVNSALLSRCRVFVLSGLSEVALSKIINRALKDKERGLGGLGISISDSAIKILIELANGDARVALNILETATNLGTVIDAKIIKESSQKTLNYDKAGDEHYNLISALHKSMRGSDADASLYYLARMLQGGEDPLYIARRLIRFASEDIGIANSQALVQAVATYQACNFIGMPECAINLAQCVVYMAKSKKSNDLYSAYNEVCFDVNKYGNLEVPLYLRNMSDKLLEILDCQEKYQYPPDYQYQEDQTYLPFKLKDKKYLKL